VGITVIFVLLGQMTSMLEGSWLMLGENIWDINIILQKMLPAKDAKVKVIKSLISNARLDLAQERKAWKAVLNVMNSRAKK
jgi:hypothetical protein